jgi:hypothetical protein
MFQAYATQKALEKLGHEAELVNLYSLDAEKINEYKLVSLSIKSILIFLYARLNADVKKKFKSFREFHQRMKLSKRYYSFEELYKDPPKYDIHLVGSDQVWNLQKGFPEPAYLFLDFLKNGATKISYAPSFGSASISTLHHDKLNMLLQSFSAISVREREGIEIIKKATGIKAKQVLDPTFLLSAKEWIAISSSPQINKDYILCYGFDDSKDSFDMIDSIKKRLNLPIVVVSVSLFFPHKVDSFIQAAGPSEFLGLIKDAKFICTSSYHGMAFAINFRKSFLGTLHTTRNSRMASMLEIFGLEKRQLKNPLDILKMTDEDLFIDYSKIEPKIQKAITDSFNWLKGSLSKSFKHNP